MSSLGNQCTNDFNLLTVECSFQRTLTTRGLRIPFYMFSSSLSGVAESTSQDPAPGLWPENDRLNPSFHVSRTKSYFWLFFLLRLVEGRHHQDHVVAWGFVQAPAKSSLSESSEDSLVGSAKIHPSRWDLRTLPEWNQTSKIEFPQKLLSRPPRPYLAFLAANFLLLFLILPLSVLHGRLLSLQHRVRDVFNCCRFRRSSWTQLVLFAVTSVLLWWPWLHREFHFPKLVPNAVDSEWNGLRREKHNFLS